MRDEERAARARARNRIHARKSRQRKKVMVLGLRQGIEDLQAEVAHLTPWFASVVTPNLEAWRASHGLLQQPANELEDVLSEGGVGGEEEEELPPPAPGRGSVGDRLQRSRARNKLHARKSRQRKKVLMETLRHESKALARQVSLMRAVRALPRRASGAPAPPLPRPPQEMAARVGAQHPALSWKPPVRAPLAMEEEEEEADAQPPERTETPPAPSAASAAGSSASSAGPAASEGGALNALLQLAAAASSVRRAEQAEADSPAPRGTKRPRASSGSALDTLVNAAQASGARSPQAASQEPAAQRRAVNDSPAPAPVPAPAPAPVPAPAPAVMVSTAPSSAYSGYSSSGRPTQAPVSGGWAPPAAPVAPPYWGHAPAGYGVQAPAYAHAAQYGPPPVHSAPPAPRFHLSAAPAPALAPGAYRVVTNLATLPPAMQAHIASSVVPAPPAGYAVPPAYHGFTLAPGYTAAGGYAAPQPPAGYAAVPGGAYAPPYHGYAAGGVSGGM